MTKSRRKHGRKSAARVSRRGNPRVGRRKADRVTPTGSTPHVVSNGRGFVPVGSTLSGSRLVNPPKAEPYKPSIFRPPPGQMVVIMTVPGGVSGVDTPTLWWVGPAREFEYNRPVETMLSFNSDKPIHIATQEEITIKGFTPYLSGNQPLKSKRWPTPPAPPKVKPPKPLEKYTRAELTNAIDQASDTLQSLNRDVGTDSMDPDDDELIDARKRFADLMTELKRRFRVRT